MDRERERHRRHLERERRRAAVERATRERLAELPLKRRNQYRSGGKSAYLAYPDDFDPLDCFDVLEYAGTLAIAILNPEESVPALEARLRARRMGRDPVPEGAERDDGRERFAALKAMRKGERS